MGSTSPAGKAGRPPRTLPDGPVKDLVDALDELIVAAHGDGHRRGSRRRLIDYINACEPERNLRSDALSRQLGDLGRKLWGPDWEYVTLLVSYCVPAPLHQARRASRADGSTSTAVAHGLPAEEVGYTHEQALARFAGLWCAARRSTRPPGYVGPITWPDGTATPVLVDPDQAEDLPTKVRLLQRSLQAMTEELDVARRQVNHATAERERVRRELQHAHDQILEEKSGRDAAETRVAQLSREQDELIEQGKETARHIARLQETISAQTAQVTRLTELLEGEVTARRLAEGQVEQPRAQVEDLKTALRIEQTRASELNDMLRTAPAVTAGGNGRHRGNAAVLHQDRIPSGWVPLILALFAVGAGIVLYPHTAGPFTAVLIYGLLLSVILSAYFAVDPISNVSQGLFLVTKQVLQISRTKRYRWDEIGKLVKHDGYKRACVCYRDPAYCRCRRWTPPTLDLYAKNGQLLVHVKEDLKSLAGEWEQFSAAVRAAADHVIIEDLGCPVCGYGSSHDHAQPSRADHGTPTNA